MRGRKTILGFRWRPGRESSRAGTTVECLSRPHISGKKPTRPVFATSEAQTETGERQFEVPTRGKNKLPSHEMTLEEARIKRVAAHIR